MSPRVRHIAIGRPPGSSSIVVRVPDDAAADKLVAQLLAMNTSAEILPDGPPFGDVVTPPPALPPMPAPPTRAPTPINPAMAARLAVAQWVARERVEYADVKYAEDSANREMLIQAMADKDFMRWLDFLNNYIRRAELFGLDTLQGRQALGKAAVTALHTLETAVMVHGPMPEPGVASGDLDG